MVQDRAPKLSRFWALLLLAAVIALGWLLGQLTPVPVVAATNSQVAGRVDPTLGDLIAALATGAVGSFALVRDDVSDTLPGVAIAISLVPPLAVVGLTLESGAPKQALGALLLFLTNFGAILLTGLIVMAIYRVRATAVQGLGATHGRPRLAVVVVVAFVIVLAAPLAVDSAQITSQQLTNSSLTTVANGWANKAGWQVANVSTTESGVTVRAIGPLPLPNPQTLRTACVPDPGVLRSAMDRRARGIISRV